MGLHLPYTDIDIVRYLETQPKPEALRERTNRTSLSYDRTAMNFPYTPKTNLTSGMPPSLAGNCLHISLHRSDNKELRRLKRYSAVEEELAASFKLCSTEASPQELQIRALKQAMSTLSFHAQETRERVERLRGVLADRKAEPEVYEKLQRERWMEEKRQLVVDQETKAVLQYLEVLNKSSSGHTHLPTVPQPPTPTLTAEARRRANLLMFLTSTQTQAPIRSRRSSSTSFEHTLRRRTMDRVMPMKLRSSLPALALVGSIKGHSRSVSLDRAKLDSQPPSKSSNGFGPTASMSLSHDATILNVVAEDPDCGVDGLSPSESTTTDTSSHMPLFETHVSTPFTAATIDTCHILQPLTLNPEEDLQDQGGTATIFRNASRYPSDHIPANVHVSLPDYALELFSHFDQIQIATLKPIFPPQSASSSSSQPILSHSSAASTPSAHITSSLLQVPSSTPGSKPSGLRQEPSYRNLFSKPQDIFSRNGVEDRLGINLSGSGLFSKPRQPVELLRRPSTASLTLPATENVTKKIKKQWSVLWRQ